VRLTNRVRLAQVRRAAKGRDYSVMNCDMARAEQNRFRTRSKADEAQRSLRRRPLSKTTSENVHYISNTLLCLTHD
jgi:hypothetical protein